MSDSDPLEAPLHAALAQHRRALSPASANEHVDADTLARHASGDLPQLKSQAITEHLAVCADGRCNTLLRRYVAGVERATALLYVDAASRPGSSRRIRASTKTVECKDALWELMGRYAKERGANVDDVVNEAMAIFARQRGYGAELETETRTAVRPGARPVRPAAGAGAPASTAVASGGTGPGEATEPGMPTPSVALPYELVVVYAGEARRVTKDRYVIGRGRNSADLVIRDPGISRQHAMLEQHGAGWFLVDLGSTNGVFANGKRVARKKIDEGDVVFIGDHELRFAFKSRE